MPRPPKRPEHNMRSTLSILHWVPDLDEVQDTLNGAVPRAKGDVVKFGDVDDRSKNS